MVKLTIRLEPVIQLLIPNQPALLRFNRSRYRCGTLISDWTADDREDVADEGPAQLVDS